MKNRTATLLWPLAALFILFTLGSCAQPTNTSSNSSSTGLSSSADTQGNLVVNNDSGSVLVLYNGTTPLRQIPDNSTDFLVNVPNPAQSAVDLRIFKKADVPDTSVAPDVTKIFRRWSVPLSNTTTLNSRSTWRITATSAASTAGTLNFNYPSSANNYNVDIYLNGKTGAKLLSLAPGAQNKSVGVEYGTYTLLYRYWTSDNTTANGVTEMGWTSTQTSASGVEVPIIYVLNDGTQKTTVTVPASTISSGGTGTKYGYVQVSNAAAAASVPLQIYAAGTLIENTAVFTGSPTNMSTVAYGASTTYKLPIGTYVFSAKNSYNNNAEVEAKSIVITEGTSASPQVWIVNGNTAD